MIVPSKRMNPVNDASVKVESNATSKSSKAAAETMNSEMLPFGWPKLEVLSVFRGVAEQSIARIKEGNEKMKTSSAEMTDVLRATYPTAAKGAADYGVKVFEMANVNIRTAFNFFGDLMNTRSLSEVIKLSAEHAHKSFNVVSAQNKELWELAQKVATETAEPIQQGFTRILQKAA
jgi:phasin